MNLVVTHLEALTFLFAGLKLTGRVQWHWWEVCLPSVAAVVVHLITNWRSKQ